VRNRYNIGRETGSGVKVHGTEEAPREEVEKFLRDMLGEPSRPVTERMVKMREEMRVDVESGGSHQVLTRLAYFLTQVVDQPR